VSTDLHVSDHGKRRRSLYCWASLPKGALSHVWHHEQRHPGVYLCAFG